MKRLSELVIAGIFGFLLLPGPSFAQSGAYDLLLRASVLREAGNLTGALALLNDATDIKSDYRLCLEKGEIMLAAGDMESAEGEFIKASEIAEASGTFGLARVYASSGDAARAIFFLEKNIRSPFKVSERRIMTDRHLHTIDNSAQWRLFWGTGRYSEAETLLSEVEYLISIGRSGDAYSRVQEVSDRAESSDLIYAKALASYSAGHFHTAINLLNSASAGKIPAERRNRLLAESYLSLNDYRQASAFYSKMIVDEVVDPAIFLGRAQAWSGLSDSKRALSDLDYYLKLYPGNDTALRLAAKVSSASGDNNSALIYLNRSVEANPGSREAYLSRGEAWFSIRMWDHAVSDYSMALDLDPNDSELWLKKGISLLNSGKTDDACHDFYTALRQGNRKAAEYISRSCIK
jgi:tetratricopeptide (TPR) repeat protein